MKKIILSGIVYSLASLEVMASQDFNYLKHGKDWGGECNGKMQSPIDLKTSLPQNPSKEDKYQKHYHNFDTLTMAHPKWYGAPTIHMIDYSDKKYCRNYFVSKIGEDNFGSTRYDAQKVIFRAKSEHTIDGKQFDLEMQIRHGSHNGKQDTRSMLSVLFDTKDHAGNDKVSEDQIAIIDSFFEHMNFTRELDDYKKWDAVKTKEWKIEDEIPFGQLMSALDTENRWVYTAKQNSPPCKLMHYYNVLSIVYPIKEDHLKVLMAHIEGVKGVPQAGNFREIQSEDDQKPRLLHKDRTPPPDPVIEEDFQVTLTELYLTILIIWCIIAFIALLWLVYKYVAKSMVKKEEEFKGYQDNPAADTERNMNQ